jgi:hypothetical protein
MREQRTLTARIAALEKALGASTDEEPKADDSRSTLASEIEDLERRIDAMSYMDDEVGCDEFGMDGELDEVVVDDELGMDGLDDEVVEDEFAEVDEELGMGDDLDGLDDMDEVGCGAFASERRKASETKPGVEDRITQDYLSEVQGEAHGEELTTAPSMRDSAKNSTPAAGSVPKIAAEYKRRLARAAKRLDRVADYLEENGRKDLALRIDRIADAIDAKLGRRS